MHDFLCRKKKTCGPNIGLSKEKLTEVLNPFKVFTQIYESFKNKNVPTSRNKLVLGQHNRQFSKKSV